MRTGSWAQNLEGLGYYTMFSTIGPIFFSDIFMRVQYGTSRP